MTGGFRFFGPAPRGMAHTLVWGASFALMAGAAQAAGPAAGLLVTLRPGVVALESVPAAPVVAREGAQALRDREHATWQRNQALRVSHLAAVAAQAGVPVRALGSAGQALRVDLADTSPAGLEAASRRLRLHPDVLDVVPNERLHRTQVAPVIPNDTHFSRQWHLQSPASFAGALNMPPAWAKWTGASHPVTVAVVDSGVRPNHPDLAANLLPGHDFVSELPYANDGDGRDADASDPGDWVSAAEASTALFEGCDAENSSWHGTAIAGEIAAVSQNATGVAGVNWGAKVVPVRVAGKCGAVLSDLLDGVRWAAGLPVAGAPSNPHPARIINLSYGGSGACNFAYQTMVNDVRNAGALLVVAAGNDGGPLTRPADCSGVMAVTAVRGDGAKASYGNYGTQVALAAPGGSAVPGTDFGLAATLDSGAQGPVAPAYAEVAGTSFSAPLVAGVASLVLGIQPNLSVSQLEGLLKGAVRPHTVQATLAQCSATTLSQGECNCTTQTCGAGLLDADLAVTAAQAMGSSSGDGAGTGSSDTPGVAVSASGGGGATGWWWGGALWLWLAGVAWVGRRRAQGQG
ncbi:S8 family peptidase [Hydrogenophaga soli]